MEKKFTKGEWIIDKKRDTVCIDILCNNEVVATCWDDYDCVDQLRANAKLIAAAPLLLDALTNILNIMNDSEGVAGYHLNGDIAKWDEFEEIALAEEAIKKATE